MMHNIVNEKVSPAAPEPSLAAAHKIEIAQQAIDISIRRRGRIQPFPTIEPHKTALLVVDMQTGFLEPGAVAEIPAARKIVPNINRLANGLRRAEERWSGSFRPMVPALNEIGRHSSITSSQAKQRIGSAWRSPGRHEHALWRELEHHTDDPVVSKNRLTPFVDPSRQLETMLHYRGIDMGW